MRRQKADRLLKNIHAELVESGKLSLRSAVVCREGQIESAWKASSSPRVMMHLIRWCCDSYKNVAVHAVAALARAEANVRKDRFGGRRKTAEAIRMIVPVMTTEMLLRARVDGLNF